MSEINEPQRALLVTKILQVFLPELFQFMATAPASYNKKDGTNTPISQLVFTPASNQTAFCNFVAAQYGSGALTCDIYWYADTDTNGAHSNVWGLSLVQLTPGAATDEETYALQAEVTGATAPSTTSHGLKKTTITITPSSTLLAGDICQLRLKCLSAANTLTGNAIFRYMTVSWSGI